MNLQKLYTDFLTAHAAGDKSGLEKVGHFDVH